MSHTFVSSFLFFDFWWKKINEILVFGLSIRCERLVFKGKIVKFKFE